MIVRDRYAPSPTGLQHIGGIRTALFNYLFAKSRGGNFLLRLEDTDRTRFDEAYVKNLYDTFEWLGIHWDEGPDIGGPSAPYVQSERTAIYKKYAYELVEKGGAYYCFCTTERLENLRKEREASRETGYDRFCRSVPAEEAQRRAAAGEAYTIRLKIPLDDPENSSTIFHDHLLGDIEWKNSDVNPDPVLLKTDGFPTYHLANVVDDHLMNITHVLRAQEWLSSTPLHVIMYAAFGWTPPEYCHLPMVIGEDGKKLSKRHGATSVDEFRLQGYLPEALINYIALVGASYEDGKDIYTTGELIKNFSLEKLNKASGVFDYKKLDWFNGQYIRMKTDEELAALVMPWAIEEGLFAPNAEPDSGQYKLFVSAMPLIKERAVFLKEIPSKLGYLFREPLLPAQEEFFPKKLDLAKTIALLEKGREISGALAASPTDAEAEIKVKAFAEKEGIKLGDLMMPLRVAITGVRVSPPLFGSLRILGAETSLARIDRALAALGKS